MDNGIRERLLGSEGKEVGNLKGKVYDESKKIWRVALPGIIARVASFGTIIVTQSFIGHINSLDLAGYALVQTLSVRFINGILVTFCSISFHLLFLNLQVLQNLQCIKNLPFQLRYRCIYSWKNGLVRIATPALTKYFSRSH